MNREQRRKATKNMGLKPGERLTLTAIMVQFSNGQAMYLDTGLVQIIDKQTNKPLFEEVLEALPGTDLPTSVTEQQPAADNIESPGREFPEDDTQNYSV